MEILSGEQGWFRTDFSTNLLSQFKVKVRSGGAAGGADITDDLSARHILADINDNLAHVRV